MAQAVYSTDLQTINDADAITGYTEPTGATAGGTAVNETDYFIQGVACVSKTFAATGLGGLHYNNATGITIPTDGAVLYWIYWSAPNSVATKANGGQRLTVGSAAGAYRNYYVAGSDTQIYGGWTCYPINPTITPSLTTGSPNTTYQYFGYVVNNTNSIQRGNPFGLDAMRYGRGTLQVVGGDLTNGYANFLGMSDFNDANTTGSFNRFGLFQKEPFGFRYQGLMLLGTAADPVDFRDSNDFILIPETEFVTPNFNTIEVRNSLSRVEWTGVTVDSLSASSRGRFLVTDNAVVVLDTCVFIDMGTFDFLSNTTATSSTFRRCDSLTQNNSVLTNCVFDRSNSTSALNSTVATINRVQGCEFVKGTNTSHALTLTGSADTSITLTNLTFTGYSSTSGSTGSEAVFVDIASGSLQINISGGNTPSIRTAGASVTVISGASVELTGLVAGTEVRAYLGTDPATATEIAGTESSSTTFSFSQNYTGQSGYIAIFALGYTPLFLDIVYSSTDRSIPIQQVIDRVYDNDT